MTTLLNKQAEALTGGFNFAKSEFTYTFTNFKKFHCLLLCYKVKYTDPSLWTSFIFRRLNYQSSLYIYLFVYDFIISFHPQSSNSRRHFRFSLSVSGLMRSAYRLYVYRFLRDHCRTPLQWVVAVLNGINLCLNNGGFDGKRLWKSRVLESALKWLNYLISPRSLPQN